MVSDTAQGVVALGNTAAGLGMKTNSLKAWETTFKAMGFAASDADQALGAIQDRITGQLLNPSMQVASAFSMMGINLRKTNGELRTSEDILTELAAKFKKLKPEYAIALGAQAAGLSRDQVIQLRNNPNFAKTLAEQKNKPVVTPQGEKQARKFVAKEADFESTVDQLKNNALLPLANEIQDKVLPQMKALAQGLADLVNNVVNADLSKPISGEKLSNAYKTLTNPNSYSAKKGPGFIDNLIHQTPKDFMNIIRKIQAKIENAAGEKIGYAMTRDKNDKYTYKLDKNGNKIPEAYGKYQIKPSTASQVMGRNVTPQELMNDKFNEQVRDKYMSQLLQQYGTQERALAAYNGDLKRYDKTGSTPYIDKFRSMIGTMFSAPSSTTNAVQSPAVSSTINNQRSSNVNSQTTIGDINVSANNPEDFARMIKGNMPYLDRALSMTGQLA